MIQGHHFMVPNDLLAVDIDVPDRPFLGRIDKTAQRIPERSHFRILEIDQHQIRLGADFKPADIVPLQGPGAPTHAWPIPTAMAF